ncbi:lysophospholipid acyltransferase family protein [uncultured Desulfobacter sp.]|uniref:lysophospholipid acyltransferase family protein n=1 Tax=uncultured Desulfobacter sp. TaxID=240139 RepID=UPI002AAB9F56|nr:lysophospholipid acyltransferase family protein [uncultured Desulfobacter sp.]
MPSLYEYYTRTLHKGKAGVIFLFIMNLFLGVVMVIWTITGMIIFPAFVLYFKLFKDRSAQWTTRWAIWVYGHVWQFFTRFFVVFEPFRYNPDQFAGPGIIVVNHRSFFDTYCMNMLPVCDVCFAVRNWPFRIPVYNIFMGLARYLNIEKFPWQKSLAIAQETFDRGGVVLFFPEGHRSRDKQLTRYYSGAFKMAVETNVPVIPVCITGTQELLPPGRYYMKPARIKMTALAPVYPDAFTGELGHQEMKKKVKQMMAEQLAAMDGTP